MALQTYPPTAGTVDVIHSGPVDGEAFSGLLTSADGGPTLPQSEYIWTLATVAPDLEGLFPVVQVFTSSGVRVETDVQVTSSTIKVSFVRPVEPGDYRIKVIG